MIDSNDKNHVDISQAAGLVNDHAAGLVNDHVADCFNRSN
tara:strand:+ start:4464 stop:4583 length:120 start_codon:yes stop_codon:yes gene_type:complete